MSLIKLPVQLIMFFKNIPLRRFWGALSILLFINLTLLAQQWTWSDFSPPNSGWRVLAPGPLQPDEEAQKNGSKGSYVYNDFRGFFAVIYQTYSKWDLFTKKNRFNKQRDLVIKANKGQLLKDEEYNQHGMNGREVQVKFAAGTLTPIEGRSTTKYRVQRFRMFFQGKRFFVVLAVVPESDANTPEIDNFLNSFSINSEPEAFENTYSVDEDNTLNINVTNGVLSNDKDADNDKLSVSSSKPISEPEHGTLTLNKDGSFTYKPNSDFNGKDTFTYKASDGVADSEIARVTINVNPVNDSPIISNVPTTLTADELTSLTFDAVARDIDNPSGSLRFSLNGAPEGAVINPQTGAFRWTANEAQGKGNYKFKVAVTDGNAIASAPINITINEVNVAPQIIEIPAAIPINELEPYTLTIRATDSDIPVQPLTFSLTGAPESISINPTTGVINWTPSEVQGDGSTFKFTVNVSDGIATQETNINLTVKEVNSAPILEPIAAQMIDELKTLSIKLNGSDKDLPANDLSYSLETNAPPGMVINPKSGEISWTPSEEQGSGDYSVTVRMTDNGTPGLFDTKTFKVRVNEVNSAPKLVPIGNQIVKEETSLTFNVTATDPDLPANSLSYSLINAPTGATLDSASGRFNWTPTETQGPGTYNLTIRVTDNGVPALSAETTLTIKVDEVNKAPIASDLSVNTQEDSVIALNLTATDPDLPLNSLKYSIVSAPKNGKLSGTGSNLTYTPSPDFNGSDNFTFKVSDGLLDSNTATIQISVKPVNDEPVANPDSVTTELETPITVNVLANDTDIDGDNLVLTNVTNSINGKVEIVNNQTKFTPDSAFQGTASFEYQITDKNGGTAKGKVTIKVNSAKPN